LPHLIFTMHESERITKDVRAAGAHGYVQKSQAGRDLVVAIDALLAGGTFFGGTSRKKAEGIFLQASRSLLGFVLQLDEA
jgi:DNA-binding NarL/FixJ family response regulator